MGFPFIPIIGGIWAGIQAFQGLINPQPEPPSQPPPQQQQPNILLYVILGFLFLLVLGTIFRSK